MCKIQNVDLLHMGTDRQQYRRCVMVMEREGARKSKGAMKSKEQTGLLSPPHSPVQPGGLFGLNPLFCTSKVN